MLKMKKNRSVFGAWTLPLFLTLLHVVEPAKILVLVPMSTLSETHFVAPIVNELAKRGHEVTYVTNSPGTVLPHPNVTEILPLTYADVLGDFADTKITRDMYWFNLFPDMSIFSPTWDKLYSNPEFRNLQNQKFDLIFMNTYFGHISLGLVHRIQAPLISLHTMSMSNLRGSSVGYYMPPSLIPHPLIEFSDKMNFFQRLVNFVVDWGTIVWANLYHFPLMEEAYRKHLGEDIPPIKDILNKQQSLLITNTHHLTNFHRPLMPDVIEAGCLHCHPPKPLPTDLEKAVNKDAAPEGFIVFSIGTLVNSTTVPEELIQKFVRVFSNLKQKVVWKWDADHIANISSNVILRKWLPQQDLLGHPNIRLFLSHSGLLSTHQAVYHGNPVLAFPFWFDQGTNAKIIPEKGIGEILDFWSFTEEQLESTIHKIINEPKYKQQAQTLAEVFKSQPQTPLERVMFWTEHVLKFKGASHLRSSARELNIFQQHSLDAIAFLAMSLLVVVIILYTITKNVLVLVLRNDKPTEGKKKPKLN